MLIFALRVSTFTIAATATLVGCGGSQSHVLATAQGVTFSQDKAPPAYVFIPNIFPGERIQHQTHSVLVLSADAAVAENLQVTRVLNATTEDDIVDPLALQTSLSTRVPLGVADVRDHFVYGQNVLRLETTSDQGELGYSERLIVLRDYSVGTTGLSSGIVQGFSAGQVESLTGPVQVGQGGVLTSSFIPMVYQ